MNTQHTPGPWALCEDGINVFAPDAGTAITNITNALHPGAPDDEEARANAHLIAAAPDLLAFARAVVRYAGNAGDDFLADQARVVIAKATGEASKDADSA